MFLRSRHLASAVGMLSLLALAVTAGCQNERPGPGRRRLDIPASIRVTPTSALSLPSCLPCGYCMPPQERPEHDVVTADIIAQVQVDSIDDVRANTLSGLPPTARPDGLELYDPGRDLYAATVFRLEKVWKGAAHEPFAF